jgi:predicted kinase
MRRDLTLVLLAGMPGVGKTTLALMLSQIWDWPVLDKDSLTSPLLTGGVSPELAGPASYTLMLEIASRSIFRPSLIV